jgi:hypothetical protein
MPQRPCLYSLYIFLLNGRTSNLEGMCFSVENPFVLSTTSDLVFSILVFMLAIIQRSYLYPPNQIIGEGYTLEETYISMYQESIFQHLSKQETVLEITETSSIRLINIQEFSESATSASSRVDGNKSVPGPVTILLVTGDAVGVVE